MYVGAGDLLEIDSHRIAYIRTFLSMLAIWKVLQLTTQVEGGVESSNLVSRHLYSTW